MKWTLAQDNLSDYRDSLKEVKEVQSLQATAVLKDRNLEQVDEARRVFESEKTMMAKELRF